MEDTNDRVFEALLIDWWELFGPGHELQLTTTHEDAAVRLSFTGLGYEPRKWDAGQWPRYVEAFVLLLTASHVNPRAFRHLVLLRCHLHVPSRRMETDAFIPCYLELSATEDSTWPREAIMALLTRRRSRNASNAFKRAMAKLLALVDDPELRRECEELVIPVRLKLGYSMTEYHIDMLSSLVSRTQSNQDDQDVVFRLDSVDIYIMMHTASQPLVETHARCKGLPLGAVALPYPDDTEENRRRFSQRVSSLSTVLDARRRRECEAHVIPVTCYVPGLSDRMIPEILNHLVWLQQLRSSACGSSEGYSFRPDAIHFKVGNDSRVTVDLLDALERYNSALDCVWAPSGLSGPLVI